MSSFMDNNDFQKCTQSIEQLIERVTALEDDEARTTALDLLQSLMDLHGAALSRVIEVLSDSGEGGKLLGKLNEDPLVCGLLVLYGIHPIALEDRVNRAIEKANTQLQKQSATVELVHAAESRVQVRVRSSGHGCSSSPEKLRSAVEQAIREAAPEIAEIMVDGIPDSNSAFVPVEMIQPVTREETTYEESTSRY
jgi:Fe-S cluster biogenesis protein NfuA